MQTPYYTKPWYILLLTMPAGISQGFVTVAMPYLLVQHGFSVAQSSGIIAVGFSANLWRFLWGPIVDISLSLKKWFWISLACSTAALLYLCGMDYSVQQKTLLTLIIFLSQVSATFMLLPINGFMAKCIPEQQKGKASGFYQAGSLVGVGMGGGAGLWLATHYNTLTAGIGLSALSVLIALVMLALKDVPHEQGNSIGAKLVGMGKDIISMIKIPAALLAILLMTLPIGTGASANLWSAIATDWHTNPDTVALVTGVLSGLLSALGCVVGGWIIDRWNNWATYMATGLFCALVALAMALAPLQPWVYVTGVLLYTFGIGMVNAAFTSVILYAIGKRNVATKFSLLASLGNLPVVYMTAINGWAHDQYNSKYMLLIEAAVGVVFIILFTILLQRMRHKNLVPAVLETNVEPL